jgi:hypothetical protein
VPDEASKPYSSDVMDLVVQIDAIDWTTNTFREAKLDDVTKLLATFGNGLTETQKALLPEIEGVRRTLLSSQV